MTSAAAKGPVVWQVGGGPMDRTYADVFLRYGVALIGPGDPGPWNLRREDDDFGGSYVRRFASEVQQGHVILLRSGVSTIRAVGLVDGAYQYLPQFDDVNGWDLQHVRRVRWSALPQPFSFGGPVFGTNPGPLTLVANLEVLDFAVRFVQSPPFEWQSRPLPALPAEEPLLEEIPGYLADLVGLARDLTPLYWDPKLFGDHPSEGELVAHFVVPLLRRLGWPVELIGVEWRRVDVAVFERLPRTPESCRLIIEAKRFGAGVEGALQQAKDYLAALGVSRDVVVTDGTRYRLYEAAGDFAPTAYANLSRLKRSGLTFFERLRRVAASRA
jgi:hypothetical protein